MQQTCICLKAYSNRNHATAAMYQTVTREHFVGAGISEPFSVSSLDPPLPRKATVDLLVCECV
jgi:hypothetical protein